MKQYWPIFSLFSALFAATLVIFAKNVSNIDVFLEATFLTTIMALTFITFLILVKKIKLLLTIDQAAFVSIILTGVLSALGWLCYLLALNSAPKKYLTIVAALDRFSIAFIAIFAMIFFGEKLSIYSVIGILLFLSGIMLLAVK